MESCRQKEIFFLGAGGIMMSSLALLTAKAGFSVRGSDRSPSALTRKLEDAGISMFYGHSRDNIGENCGAVVYTVAVSPDNPEYTEAHERGIPCISRADYLGYIMTAYKNRVGIAGMHGKSSCTSMCAEIFLDAAKNGTTSDPTIVSGAEYSSMGGAYYLGEHDNFVFEACEYMDSFLDFNPTVAVLLNAELEHVDYFKSIEHIRDSFTRYASLVGKDGVVIYNADDDNIVGSVEKVDAKKISFGLSKDADFRAVRIDSCKRPMEFDILYGGRQFAHIRINALGIHNVYNALAAAAAAFVCGIDADDISVGLFNFKGAKRRMEYKGELCGAAVYDDYGHHPTEIGATLCGAKDTCDNKLICVFQPHTYSRTAALINDFKMAFECADKVILADIYAAREVNEYGISSQKLAEIIGDKAIYGGDFDSIAELLRKTASKNDTVVVMGAGDIFKLFEKLGL
jgi:UDP-N-acetylmuramate--alanine ligase